MPSTPAPAGPDREATRWRFLLCDGRKSIGVRLFAAVHDCWSEETQDCPGDVGLNAGDRSSSKRHE